MDTVDEAVQRFRSVSAAGAVATEGAQAREAAEKLLSNPVIEDVVNVSALPEEH